VTKPSVQPARIAVSPLASSSETQTCCHLVNVDELTRVVIDACCTQSGTKLDSEAWTVARWLDGSVLIVNELGHELAIR